MAEFEAEDALEAVLPDHGGDLAFAARHYGMPAEGWLDLSTGINPNGYTPPVLARHLVARLPDQAELDALIATARTAYGAPASVAMLATPGTELAVRLLPHVAPPGTVAIVGPTYSSHRAGWTAADRDIVTASSLAAVPSDATTVIVGNPNNPDGRTCLPEELAPIARSLAERNGLLIVDEAYADLRPDLSLMPQLADTPALVLRSVGKFYGLGGIRLGFAAGHRATIERLREMIGAWPVSGPAIAVGKAALADDGWRNQKRRRLKHDGERLRKILAAHNLAIAGSTDLFALVEDTHARQIHRQLAERGIWTRVFHYEWRWIRFGLPTEAGFGRLERALNEIRPSPSA